MALAEHASEVTDQLVDCPQGWAAVKDLGQVGSLLLVAVGGWADDPADNLAGFGRGRWDLAGRGRAGAPSLEQSAY
ncbi:hypothetical protein [Amycolatopsis sp. A1MSW2902]|uniref:hypothetical protein n=1 Tax=Amycolatopsis sp. A1MSW2902 TaxID=687413 RepID=UPI00307ECB9D